MSSKKEYIEGKRNYTRTEGEEREIRERKKSKKERKASSRERDRFSRCRPKDCDPRFEGGGSCKGEGGPKKRLVLERENPAAG